MPSLIQKHAHMKGQRSNHHIFKFQPIPSWAKKRPNRYTSFEIMTMTKFKRKMTEGYHYLAWYLVPVGQYYSEKSYVH